METEAAKIVKKGLFTDSERFSCRHWAYYSYKNIEETFRQKKNHEESTNNFQIV